MLAGQITKCREFTGPTPHSVAVRAKVPVMRPLLKDLFVDKRKQEEAREELLDFTKYQQKFDVKNTWVKNADQRFVRETTQRQVRDAMKLYEMSIDERRNRLRSMLEAEERNLLQEIEDSKETMLARHVKMRERLTALKDKRECERQQFVEDKMEQLFRDQNEELRHMETKRRQREVCMERAAQLSTKQVLLQQQQEEEKLFAELWEANRLAKEERENRELQRQHQSHMEQLGYLKAQMEASEQKRQQAKQLKEEEAKLLREQREMQRLEQEREQLQKLQRQEARRRQLERGLRIKMRRLAREQQEELALDISILRNVLAEAHDEEQFATQRKLEMREEQQRYRQYLMEELEKQKEAEQEMEQLIKEENEEIWVLRNKRSLIERDARDRLMKDVMESWRLQIQEKLDMNSQKQTEVAKEREELKRTIQEMKQSEEEEKICQKEESLKYQADLRAQIMHQEQLRLEEKALEEKEYKQRLALQEQYDKKVKETMSKPNSRTIAVHPFRRPEQRSTQSN